MLKKRQLKINRNIFVKYVKYTPHRALPPQSSSSWVVHWRPAAWCGVWIGLYACRQEDRWTTDCSSDWTDTLPTGVDWNKNALPACRPFWFPVWNKKVMFQVQRPQRVNERHSLLSCFQVQKTMWSVLLDQTYVPSLLTQNTV